MISRRSALGATIALPAALLSGGNAYSAIDDTELSQIRRLIAAFFAASNANNWSFVRDSLDDSAHAKTNDNFWSPWSFDNKNEDIIKLRKDGPFGYLPDADSIYSFMRSRQYKKGWKWVLPKDEDSIWSPDFGVFCSYSKWERTDGGSYQGSIPIARNPTYFHIFGISTNEQFGAVVSRKISWIQEVSLRNIVYG